MSSTRSAKVSSAEQSWDSGSQGVAQTCTPVQGRQHRSACQCTKLPQPPQPGASLSHGHQWPHTTPHPSHAPLPPLPELRDGQAATSPCCPAALVVCRGRPKPSGSLALHAPPPAPPPPPPAGSPAGTVLARPACLQEEGRGIAGSLLVVFQKDRQAISSLRVASCCEGLGAGGHLIGRGGD